MMNVRAFRTCRIVLLASGWALPQGYLAVFLGALLKDFAQYAMRAWHIIENTKGNLTLLCDFFVFQKNTCFFIGCVKCFLNTFAELCRRYGFAD